MKTTQDLLVAGNVVQEKPRREMIRDAVNHLAHHRGQLTAYLRLNDVPVPSIYGRLRTISASSRRIIGPITSLDGRSCRDNGQKAGRLRPLGWRRPEDVLRQHREVGAGLAWRQLFRT